MNANIKLIDCGQSIRILYKKNLTGIITSLGEYWQIQGEEKIYKSQDEAIAMLIARSHHKSFQSERMAGFKGKIIR
ncbi:MAG: hypothetical protein ACRC11_09460 [Xenococcaceae cyanobacterium]